MANLSTSKFRAFTMPKWGIEMSEGTIAEWMVAEGQPFPRGTVLTLIETDKITNEFEAEADGCLVRLIAQPGETYAVGALIAVYGEAGSDAAEVDAFVGSFKAANTAFAGMDEPEPAPAPASAPASAPAPVAAPAATFDPARISPAGFAAAQAAGLDPAAITGSGKAGRISLQDVHQAARQAPTLTLTGPLATQPETPAFASPMARRLAAKHGVDLASLTGTGPRGRISKADVLAVTGPAISGPVVGGPPVIEAMSRIRKTIARRLTESKTTIPHFYVRRRVRVDKLMKLRAAANSGSGPKLSVNDYLIRACGLALAEVPALNIQVHGDTIHRFAGADIAVAVATDSGLITPIVTNAGARSLADIRAVTADLAARARSGRLKQHEFEGGSFSLSNLGMFGVEQFDAIINPPQGAILAVGAARPEPIDDDGAIRIVPVLHLALSCDHRAIDGADAARFMMALANLLEHPEGL